MHLQSKWNIHLSSPPQGADKNEKTPEGKSVFEVAESDDMKALLKWDAAVREVAGQVGKMDRQMDAVVLWQKMDSPYLNQPLS